MKYDFGGEWLSSDVGAAQKDISAKGSRLAGAKKSGAGIGGLLGALAATILTGGAATPLLLAAAGGGGALLGSTIGGATSGVKDSDLDGKFLQGTRAQLKKDISKAQFNDVLKSALTSALGGANYNKFGAGFADSFKAAGDGVKGAIPGLQGGAPLLDGEVPGFGDKLFRGLKQGIKNVYGEGQFGLNKANMGAFGLDKLPTAPEMGPKNLGLLGKALPGNVTGDATSTMVPGLSMETEPVLPTIFTGENAINPADWGMTKEEWWEHFGG